MEQDRRIVPPEVFLKKLARKQAERGVLGRIADGLLKQNAMVFDLTARRNRKVSILPDPEGDDAA